MTGNQLKNLLVNCIFHSETIYSYYLIADLENKELVHFNRINVFSYSY